ncbi:MAG: hypothetical protein GY778_19710, partial [bacterium]|nr:hypothetical protein [bacterium]
PELVTGVWVGFDLKVPIGENDSGTGAMAALPIWARFMKAAAEIYGSPDFEVPEGLTSVRTCVDSGLLATPDCPQAVDDLFLPETEPVGPCRLHRGHIAADNAFETLDRQLLPEDRWLRQAGGMH